MTELSHSFGRVVAEVRGRRGLSQERLAELAGLHRDTIRRVENDKMAKDGPTLDTIERIARGLGMHPSELLALADGSDDSGESEEE